VGHAVLNGLGGAGRWQDAVKWVQRDSAERGKVDGLTATLLFCSLPTPNAPRQAEAAEPPTAKVAAKRGKASQARPAPDAAAATVVRLFRALSYDFDDLEVPPIPTSVVAHALAATDEWATALRLLARFDGVPCGQREHTALGGAARRVAACSEAAARAVGVLTLAAPQHQAQHQALRVQHNAARRDRIVAFNSQRPSALLRPSRHEYFKPPTVTASDAAASLHVAHAPAAAPKADAFDDPRPAPSGLHDKASGWEYYGRGGVKVGPDSNHVANPLGQKAKKMHKMFDPSRTWYQSTSHFLSKRTTRYKRGTSM
jgi:hypothetical protein